MSSLAEKFVVVENEDPETDPPARPEELRLLEALLFASAEPLDEKTLAERLPEGVDIAGSLGRLQLEYAPRGVNLVRVAGKWTFRTANDLAWLMSHNTVEPRKLSRAAIETLAIIAYHQPVTRAEIEDIRGVSTSKGSVDVLLQTGWIRPRGRRKSPGRPVTYGTNDTFLSHFGLEVLGDLPGLDELKGSGLLDGRLPAGFSVPMPSDDPALRDDEDPLEPGDLDLGLAPRVVDEAVEEVSAEVSGEAVDEISGEAGDADEAVGEISGEAGDADGAVGEISGETGDEIADEAVDEVSEAGVDEASEESVEDDDSGEKRES